MKKKIVLILSVFGYACSIHAAGIQISSTSFIVDIHCNPQYRFCARGDLALGTELTIFPEQFAGSCRAKAVASISQSVTGLEKLTPCSDAFDDGCFIGITGRPIRDFRPIYTETYFPKLQDDAKKKILLAQLKKSDAFRFCPPRTVTWDGWNDFYPIDQPLEVYTVPDGKNVFLIHIPSLQFHPGPFFMMVDDKFYCPGNPWARMIGFYVVDGRKLIKIESDDPVSHESSELFYWIDENPSIQPGAPPDAGTSGPRR